MMTQLGHRGVTAMTYIDEAELRRPSRGTKVLAFGFGILAVLASFWGIVWFIRSYVEPPRVMMPSPLALAARDSTPVSPPQTKRAEAAPDRSTTASIGASVASADPADRAATTGAIADRWAPLSQAARATTQVSPAPRETVPAISAPMGPPPTIAATPAALAAADPASLPTISAATSLATLNATSDADVIEEVAESFVPAIRGPAPLPRRRPVMTASAAKRNNAEPPLPRPRPDGPAPQSVFTGVPVTDDRFPTQ
jgi:cytoskeletal protein RodZ